MEKIFDHLQHLTEEMKEYVNVRIDLVKLNLAEKASSIAADTMAIFISAMIFLFFLFFASTGLALFLSGIIGKSYSGFLIVAGLYLILGLVIWFAREKLIQIPIMNSIIRQLFSNDRKAKRQ